MAKFAGMAPEEAPAKMTVMHPISGEPMVLPDGTECYIEGYPSTSKRGTMIDRELMYKQARKRNGQRMTPRDIEEGVNEKAARLVTDWKLMLLDGTPIDDEPTPENCIEMFTDARWLRDQWLSFVADLGNFQATPSPSS